MTDRAGPELDAKLAEALGWQWWRSRGSGRRALYRPGHQPEWMTVRADMTEPICYDVEEQAGMVPWVPFSVKAGKAIAAAEQAVFDGRIADWVVGREGGSHWAEVTITADGHGQPLRYGDSPAHALTLALLAALRPEGSK